MGNDIFKKPECVKEAADAKKGLNWALEILVFIAVFLVTSIVMFLPMVAGQVILLINNPEYMRAVMAGDMNNIVVVSMEIAYSDVMMALSLFCDGLMILFVCLFCKLFQKRRMRTLGFVKKGMVKEYLIGVLVGTLIFSAAVLGSVVTGATEIDGLDPNFSIGMFFVFVAGFMVQGMAEEVLCRGYFMISFARRWPMWAAVLANSVLFAALHLFNSGLSVLAFVNLALFGVFASLYFIYRGNIWGIGAFHSAWNLVQGNLYGIKVSGSGMGPSLLASTAVEGKDLLNGGAFGMEGSIMVTIVLLIGIAFLFVKTQRKTER